ncbi:MAG: hypothetical protein AAFP69_09580, partial [Planctomycetota bacterium]
MSAPDQIISAAEKPIYYPEDQLAAAEADQSNENVVKVTYADRVGRLPPYMFGRINAMLYDKRRDG